MIQQHRRISCWCAQVVMFTIVSLIWQRPLAAQTRFAEPDTSVNFASYRTGEECQAAVQRVARRFQQDDGVWPDTIFWAHAEVLDSLPTNVIKTAQACAARHIANDVSTEQYASWARVYLAANQDADAHRVIQRRLSAFPLDSVMARRNILSKVYNVYAYAQPVRIQQADAVMDKLEQLLRADDLPGAFALYRLQMGLARQLMDTARQREVAERTIAYANSLAPEVRHSAAYDTVGTFVVLRALDIVRHAHLLDSLRRSADAYMAIKQANWAEASGQRPGALQFPVGKLAHPLEGDFWFASAPPTGAAQHASASTKQTGSRAIQPVSRPTAGRVNLILFLRGGCHDAVLSTREPIGRTTWRSACWGTYSSLRRIAKQFPQLDITIVSQTTGYVGNSAPLNPEDEANLLRQWWLDYHKLPGTLVVTNTPFFRLQDPDRRRIDSEIPNNSNYSFGKEWSAVNKQAYVIDPSGVIVHADILDRNSERDFLEILRIVIDRYNHEIHRAQSRTTP